MRSIAYLLAGALCLMAAPLAAQTQQNADMKAIFDADQAARADAATIDWEAVSRDDAARRHQTRALLDRNALNTAEDYWHAAFVFQHGGEPADYLLAHTLAVIAAAKGHPGATWIAAATLDRYLQAIGQPQIYGTQFRSRDGAPVTQQPYDSGVVSDALRRAMGVPPLAEQETRRKALEVEWAKPPLGKAATARE